MKEIKSWSSFPLLNCAQNCVVPFIALASKMGFLCSKIDQKIISKVGYKHSGIFFVTSKFLFVHITECIITYNFS